MIPTVWIDEPDGEAIKAAFETLGCDDLVVKQQIGASSRGQHRLALGDPLPKMNQPMMAQAFQPSILFEGEYSFIFICLLYTSPSPRDQRGSRMPSSA